MFMVRTEPFTSSSRTSFTACIKPSNFARWSRKPSTPLSKRRDPDISLISSKKHKQTVANGNRNVIKVVNTVEINGASEYYTKKFEDTFYAAIDQVEMQKVRSITAEFHLPYSHVEMSALWHWRTGKWEHNHNALQHRTFVYASTEEQSKIGQNEHRPCQQ